MRHQAITWTNADLLLIWSLGTSFNEIRIEIQTFHSWKCSRNVVVSEMAVMLSTQMAIEISISWNLAAIRVFRENTLMLWNNVSEGFDMYIYFICKYLIVVNWFIWYGLWDKETSYHSPHCTYIVKLWLVINERSADIHCLWVSGHSPPKARHGLCCVHTNCIRVSVDTDDTDDQCLLYKQSWL